MEVINDKRKTAIHEAGHTVACERLMPGRYVAETTIITNEEEGYYGAHVPLEPWDHNAAEAQQEVLCMCAGYAACVVAGMPEARARDGCGSDFDYAEKLIADFGLPPLEKQLAAAVELMSKAENKRAVQRLADELIEHKTLTSDEIHVLIDVADGGTSEKELAVSRQFQRENNR